MKILLAILIPPLAVLICGRPIQLLFNIIFCLIGVWIGGIIHAVYIVSQRDAEKRNEELIHAIRNK